MICKHEHFVWTDAGKSTSKRPKDFHACSVQSAAIAFNVSYDESFDVMKKYGRNKSGMWLRQYIHALNFLSKKTGRVVEKLKLERKYDTYTFLHTFRKGTFIVDHHDHLSVIVDGIIHDHIFTFHMPIERVWQIR